VRKVGLAWFAVVAFSACGGGSGSPVTDGSADRRSPDGSDAVVTPDAPAERSGDVSPDVASEAPGDAPASSVAETGADGASQAGDLAPDAPSDTGGSDGPLATTYCARGMDVAGVTPPAGFCVKRYAAVAEARTLAVAPNGDVFVGAPSRVTPGGSQGGPGAIVLLTDDDHNGMAESHVFLSSLSSTVGLDDVHGLALGGGSLYFTTQTSVWRVPYVSGQRTAGTPVDLGLPPTFATGGRWTHGLALSKGGQLFASRGAYATCGLAQQAGEISAVAATGALTTVANGFRNPMYMRCHAQDEVCAAMELGEDLAAGAHEKMVVLRPGTSYGYPCCYTKAAPATMTAMCDAVTQEEATFPLSDTPFGFDWAPATWPAPYANAIFVALHGSAYSVPEWQGASLVFAAANPTTHVPVQDWQPFLGGFGPDGTALERPADVAFAPDGRLFFADDEAGVVYFIAPVGLQAP
jgi:glucose/arabinose dehydrogenase